MRITWEGGVGTLCWQLIKIWQGRGTHAVYEEIEPNGYKCKSSTSKTEFPIGQRRHEGMTDEGDWELVAVRMFTQFMDVQRS